MRVPVLTAFAAAALLLSGCGGGGTGGSDVASVSGGGSATAAGSQPSEDPHQRNLKFAQCMRENGVEVPDPEPGKGLRMRFDGSVPREAVEKAQEACKQYAPSGQRSGQGDPKMAENLRKLSQCMRDNGVEGYPDPEGGMMRITRDLAEDPDFESAQDKCQQLAADAGMAGS
ncbi:hypothetical protein [Nonomuraea jiangxiensis]|uniref:Lipoprotein n=1 Tax=Nonomuraea jiangxiensis TaxID=633440 RepID=A0A1G9A3C7_9ACTN|nr:hypothetical protein [Nonomuraea jiangxiensis]SDK21862.1 hypothetical protein SAMN05421869_114264 [Nonomuraea jiangxiensis]